MVSFFIVNTYDTTQIAISCQKTAAKTFLEREGYRTIFTWTLVKHIDGVKIRSEVALNSRQVCVSFHHWLLTALLPGSGVWLAIKVALEFIWGSKMRLCTVFWRFCFSHSSLFTLEIESPPALSLIMLPFPAFLSGAVLDVSEWIPAM